MDKEIEASVPDLAELAKQVFDRGFVGHIARKNLVGADAFCKRSHAFLQHFALIGEG